MFTKSNAGILKRNTDRCKSVGQQLPQVSESVYIKICDGIRKTWRAHKHGYS
jgi:hypothetical protein